MLQTLAKIYLKAEEAEQAENIIEQAMKLADEQKACRDETGKGKWPKISGAAYVHELIGEFFQEPQKRRDLALQFIVRCRFSLKARAVSIASL